MADTLNQYKSNLTPQEVDEALHKIGQVDDSIVQAQSYAEKAKQYAESIDPYQFVQKSVLINLVYPVGSIYMSANNVSPASFLGGTWQPIQGRFLLGADSAYTAGTTGGEAAHVITRSELPDYQMPVGGSYRRGTPLGQTYNGVQLSESTNDGNIPSCNVSLGGGGQPHNNLPPYLAVYMWKRTE